MNDYVGGLEAALKNEPALSEFEIYEIELYARDRLANDRWPPRGQVLRVLQNIVRLCQEVKATE